jgi:hypothetical protein
VSCADYWDSTPAERAFGACRHCGEAYAAHRLSATLREDRERAELAELRAELERAQRRAASWKLVAKHYRRDSAAWEEYFRAERDCVSEPLRAERDWLRAELMSSRQNFDALRDAFAAHMARVPLDLCASEGSAQASSGASSFPGAWAPGMQGEKKMSENQKMQGAVSIGAEGGTLATGPLGQPNSARPGRFPETPCHKLANGAPGGSEDKGSEGVPDVQCQRNGTGVQGSGAVPRWALDWATVLGWPTALWCLVLRFAALAGMVPGERRQLDEAHRLALLSGGEAAAVIFGERGEVLALVLPGTALRHGELVSEAQTADLVALLSATVDRSEALFAEAELYRHAAGLLRGNGRSHHWTRGTAARDRLGHICDPHPDAVFWSLVGALRQAELERGGSAVSLAAWKRLVRLAAPACFTFKVEPNPEACRDVLRVWNDQQPSAVPVLSLLLQAAAEAEREGSGEAVSS